MGGNATTGGDFRTGEDVVTFLTGQHEQIKALFQQVSDSRGEARRDAFVALRRLLAVHETAEEEVVHPRARQSIPNGDDIVDVRLQEENEAKRKLAELEKLDVESAEFERLFQDLRADVLLHAEAEEQQEFTRLADALEPEQLERMKRAATMAESMAPTRPHPGVESAPANMLAGPFAMMLDRARDAMTGKTASAG
jgi:hemerythrin superfamily protein